MKKITVKDIYHFLCQWAPPSLAEDWDPVGLQVGFMNREVKGILVALDVTAEVLKEAKKKKCNLLITHHPLKMGSPVLLKAARKQKINVLSFHTNLDSTEEGLNDLLAQQLKLRNLKPLLKSKSKKHPQAGIGRIGSIRLITLKKFLYHVARCMKLKNFRYLGNLNRPIKKIAVVTGSGAAFFKEAKKKGADVLVTGDVKYHTALDALAEGITLVDIGHFGGEIGMVELVGEKLQKWLLSIPQGIPVHSTRRQSDPFHFWPT